MKTILLMNLQWLGIHLGNMPDIWWILHLPSHVITHVASLTCQITNVSHKGTSWDNWHATGLSTASFQNVHETKECWRKSNPALIRLNRFCSSSQSISFIIQATIVTTGKQPQQFSLLPVLINIYGFLYLLDQILQGQIVSCNMAHCNRVFHLSLHVIPVWESCYTWHIASSHDASPCQEMSFAQQSIQACHKMDRKTFWRYRSANQYQRNNMKCACVLPTRFLIG
jgi:hypothetical protein